MSKNGSKTDNPNSSESVEASLEDFINQANASFPATTDGWDLHTGDVELLEEASEQFEKVEHISEPAKLNAPVQKQPEPKRQSKSQPVVVPIAPALESLDTANDEEEPAPLEPPPSGPKRKMERTEVVSSPIQTARVPWSANPLVIIGGLLMAFVVGAGLVFFMVRTMMPTQPVVVQAPPPQIVVQPAAPVPTGQPVVTPLPSTAQPSGQPVVTPLPSTAQPAPQPVAVEPAPAPAPAPRKRVAAKAKKQAEPREERAPAPKKAAAPVEKAEKADKPAAKPAKKESKGSDWVDPFAQ